MPENQAVCLTAIREKVIAMNMPSVKEALSAGECPSEKTGIHTEGTFLDAPPLWEHLQNTTKPIYLYGMGDGAMKIIEALTRYHIPLAGIFASDEYVRGHSFAGFPVQRYRAVREQHGRDWIALLAFAINYEPMLSTLRRMNTECEFYAPDVPVVWGDGELFTPEYAARHREQLTQVWEKLADEQSRRVFLGILRYKFSGKISFLDEITTEKDEAWKTLLCPDGRERYADLGAYTGDTIDEYLQQTGGHSGGIVALEPDAKNFQKLLRHMEERGIAADCRNLGAWSEPDTLYFKGGKGGRNSLLSKEGKISVSVDSLDRVFAQSAIAQEEPPSSYLIKLDVEGAEARALEGASETICRYRPKLIVSAYHRNEDLWTLPLQILGLCPEYRVFLRHHPYIPAWDTNYYFLP